MEYVNIERIQHEFQEALHLWLQVKLESHATPSTSSVQTDFTNPLSGKPQIQHCSSYCRSECTFRTIVKKAHFSIRLLWEHSGVYHN